MHKLFILFNKNVSFAQNNSMGYFSYHKKVQNKIKNNELSSFEIVDEYHNISPCLILYFSDGTSYPIRDYMFDEYLKLIGVFE